MPGRRTGLIPNFLYCPHPPGLIYLDDVVGPSRVLLPVAGEPRRRCLRILQRQGITSNEILSQKRAENVMEYVVSLGVKPDLVSAQGFGDSNPVASNDTAQGRAQNRRVELSLAGSSC
jgi:hypothetical protein